MPIPQMVESYQRLYAGAYAPKEYASTVRGAGRHAARGATACKRAPDGLRPDAGGTPTEAEPEL